MKKPMKTAITSALLLSIFALPAEAVNYRIQAGDTLSSIAKAHNVGISALMDANNLTDDMIYPGKYLYIPNDSSVQHKVAKGESLYLIAKKYGVTPQYIRQLNSLNSDTIYPGQTLTIRTERANLSSRGYTYTATQKEIDLLARLVHGEARGESLEGQIAVAAVVLNRLHNDDFPNTISQVIYQDLAFTAVSDGQFALTPNSQAYAAVRLALSGYDPSCGSLYYWNPRTATSEWIWGRTVLLKIDRHLFGI